VDQIPIEENFRSSQGIVEKARASIERNAARLSKANRRGHYSIQVGCRRR
jgi:hypothetical protein